MARAHRHHIAAHVRHPTHRCQKREFLLEFGRDRQWTVGQAALDEGNPEQWHPCGKRARNEYFSYGSSPGLCLAVPLPSCETMVVAFARARLARSSLGSISRAF